MDNDSGFIVSLSNLAGNRVSVVMSCDSESMLDRIVSVCCSYESSGKQLTGNWHEMKQCTNPHFFRHSMVGDLDDLNIVLVRVELDDGRRAHFAIQVPYVQDVVFCNAPVRWDRVTE